MSIAFLSPAWPRESSLNGIVTYTSNIRTGLKAEGVRSYVLTGQLAGDELPGEVYALSALGSTFRGARRLGMGVMSWLSPQSWVWSAMVSRVVEGIRQIQARHGLNVFQMEESFGWARGVVRESPVPVVVRLHGPWFLVGRASGQSVDRAFRKRIEAEGRAIASAAGVTCASRYTLDQVRREYGLPLAEAEVIPNAIEPVPEGRRWQVGACQPGTILFVGRFDACKGGDLAIQAMKHVRRAIPEAQLIFVGADQGVADGCGRVWKIAEYIGQQAPANGGRPVVDYRGKLPASEIAELRRRCAVCIVPSRFENFANVVLEGMAAGSPMVVARTGGLSEMIDDGRNGLHCEAGDVADLAEKILLVLRNPGLAAELGARAAADAAERYSPARIARQTIEFYRRVIRRGSADRAA